MGAKKPSPEGVQRVADALSRTITEREIEAYSRKEQEINQAESVIYAEVSSWVGFEVQVGDAIPIVRQGERIAYTPTMMSTILGGNPARRVAEEARIEGKGELERKMRLFNSIKEGCSDTLKGLETTNLMDRILLGAAARLHRSSTKGVRRLSLETRLIREIGVVEASTIALMELLEATSGEVLRLEEQLSALSTGKRGRTRNEAAYAVALELARLYAKVTGRKPTYAEGPDGMSGEYTPALRNVFDALGWHKTGLRGPAVAARDAITDDDTEYELNKLGSLLYTVSDE